MNIRLYDHALFSKKTGTDAHAHAVAWAAAVVNASDVIVARLPQNGSNTLPASAATAFNWLGPTGLVLLFRFRFVLAVFGVFVIVDRVRVIL